MPHTAVLKVPGPLPGTEVTFWVVDDTLDGPMARATLYLAPDPFTPVWMVAPLAKVRIERHLDAARRLVDVWMGMNCLSVPIDQTLALQLFFNAARAERGLDQEAA